MTMSGGLWEKLTWTEADPERTLAPRRDRRTGGGGRPRGRSRGVAREPLDDPGAHRRPAVDAPRAIMVGRPARGRPWSSVMPRLAGGSLTAVFILSQHDAAIRRLLAAGDSPTATRWQQAIGRGEAVATVGISHLTTSRRLGSQAIRVVEAGPGRYRLDGTMPWVTGATRADLVVTGGTLDDGRMVLVALPTDQSGRRRSARRFHWRRSRLRVHRRSGWRVWRWRPPTSWRARQPTS